MKLLWIFLFLATETQIVTSGKILFLLPIASKSHHNVFEPLVLALANRSHDIVLMSPFKPSKSFLNVESIIAAPPEKILGQIPNSFEMRKQSKLALIWKTMDLWTEACHMVYDNARVQELMEKETFDLIIFDIYMDYCVAGMLSHFKAPYIFVTTLPATNYVTETIGTHQHPSFVPSAFLEYNNKMNFRERFGNTVLQWLIGLYSDYVFLPKFESIYKKRMGAQTPSIMEISRNASMIFSNAHFAMNYQRPLLPDIVEVGGMQCKPSKPLPKEFEDFINGAGKEGFILFSLGSIVKGSEMPEDNRLAFLKVFAKLKQRVIWKWETETMEGLPPNVMLKKFVPQQDILGHPSLRLFITHGGLLSLQESAYHGVPLITIPLFGDQDLNAHQAQLAGYSLTLEINDMTEEIFQHTVDMILNEPAYAERAKNLSAILRDQPQTSLERAVFWSEYVIRHKGAPQLRSAARDLNVFQYHSLDVVAAFISVVLAVLFLLYFCIVKTFRMLFGGRAKHERVNSIKKLN